MDYKFGIIGLGLIADFHAKAIEAMEGAVVHSCMSRSEKKAVLFGEKYGCRAFTSMEEMLEDPELDIVTICTPSGNHLEPSLLAIKAGKHLIIEKPMEVTLDRCNTILNAAEEKGIRLSTIFPSRFHGASKLIKKTIENNRFGKLILGDAYVKWLRTQKYYDEGGWHGTRALDGGGALMNQSIHAIDLLQWFMGPVESVKAYTGTLGHKGIEVEDIAVAVLKFKNSAMGVIEGSTAVYPGYLKKIEIAGIDGSVVLEESVLKEWNFRKELAEDKYIKEKYFSTVKPGGGASDPGAMDFSPHQMQFEDFIQSLNDGSKSLVEGIEGRKAVEIIVAIYESAEMGREVFL